MQAAPVLMAVFSLALYYHVPNNAPMYVLTDPGAHASSEATLIGINGISPNETSQSPGNSNESPWTALASNRDTGETADDAPHIAQPLVADPAKDAEPATIPELRLPKLPGDGEGIDPLLGMRLASGNDIVDCFCDSVLGQFFTLVGRIDRTLHVAFFEGVLGGQFTVLAGLDLAVHGLIFFCDDDDKPADDDDNGDDGDDNGDDGDDKPADDDDNGDDGDDKPADDHDNGDDGNHKPADDDHNGDDGNHKAAGDDADSDHHGDDTDEFKKTVEAPGQRSSGAVSPPVGGGSTRTAAAFPAGGTDDDTTDDSSVTDDSTSTDDNNVTDDNSVTDDSTSTDDSTTDDAGTDGDGSDGDPTDDGGTE